MVIADGMLNLRALPPWLLWVLACAGLTLVLGAALWISPPLRRKTLWPLPLVLALWLVRVLVSRSPYLALWMTAVLSVSAAGPLLWLGPVPDGMPRRLDPKSAVKPQYRAYVRRGRVAGLIFTVLVIAAIALSAMFVDS